MITTNISLREGSSSPCIYSWSEHCWTITFSMRWCPQFGKLYVHFPEFLWCSTVFAKSICCSLPILVVLAPSRRFQGLNVPPARAFNLSAGLFRLLHSSLQIQWQHLSWCLINYFLEIFLRNFPLIRHCIPTLEHILWQLWCLRWCPQLYDADSAGDEMKFHNWIDDTSEREKKTSCSRLSSLL